MNWEIRDRCKGWGPIFLFLSVMVVVRASFADHYLVPSGSMRPTLRVGDRILVNKMAYDLRVPLTQVFLAKVSDPVRGDIVVFTSPYDEKTTMVKRLVAGPGDAIEIKNGFIRINGIEALKEKKTLQDTSLGVQFLEKTNSREYTVNRIFGHAREENLRIVVPSDHFFMMGDNRDNSLDSRSWGFVPRKNILGRAHHVLFSANILQWPPNVSYERTLMKL